MKCADASVTQATVCDHSLYQHILMTTGLFRWVNRISKILVELNSKGRYYRKSPTSCAVPKLFLTSMNFMVPQYTFKCLFWLSINILSPSHPLSDILFPLLVQCHTWSSYSHSPKHVTTPQ